MSRERSRSRSRERERKDAGKKERDAEPDKLFFYSRSQDVAPGLEELESVADPSKYDLDLIPNFRCLLSHFDDSVDFKFEGRRWRTLEHVWQGKKIMVGDKEEGYQFCLDSGSELSKGGGYEAWKQRKSIKLTDAELEAAAESRKEWLPQAAIAKFTASYQAKMEKERRPALALLATGDAQLWHVVRGKNVRFHHLEEARRHLRERFE
jgi:hypothetical protein